MPFPSRLTQDGQAFVGSLRAARRTDHPPASSLHTGAAVRVHCYEHGSGAFTPFAALPVNLRLVSDSGSAVPLDPPPPPPAGVWTDLLAGRLHAGVFRVAAPGSTPGTHSLALSSDPRRALQRSIPSAGWSSDFPDALLARASARDAPDLARGFAAKPWRRVGAWLLIELLGGFTCAAVEVSATQAEWQAACRPWWARVLTRSLAAALLISGTEYIFTIILPIAVERLPPGLALKGGMALAAPLLGFAVWSLAINGAAGALGSAILVFVWTLLLSHAFLWPILLLLSAGLWRDVPPLPDDSNPTGPSSWAPPPTGREATPNPFQPDNPFTAPPPPPTRGVQLAAW